VNTAKFLSKLVALVVIFGLIAAACSSDGTEESAPADNAADAPAADVAPADNGADAPAADVSLEDLEGEVNISGSSTVEPVSVRTAELFEDVAPGVVVNVDGPGTGGGRAGPSAGGWRGRCLSRADGPAR